MTTSNDRREELDESLLSYVSLKSQLKTSICQRRIKQLIKVLPMVLYLIFLLAHLVGCILFAVYEIDCLRRESAVSFQCENFTIFPHPVPLATIWLWLSFIHSIICIYAVQHAENFQSYLVILQKMVKLPKVWIFSFQLVCAIVLNSMYLGKQGEIWGIVLETGHILRNTIYFWMIIFWSYSQEPPTGKVWFLYRVTLFVLMIESLLLLFIIVAQTATHVTGDFLFNTDERIQVILLFIVVSKFYHIQAQFFIYRCFSGKQNLFSKFRL